MGIYSPSDKGKQAVCERTSLILPHCAEKLIAQKRTPTQIPPSGEEWEYLAQGHTKWLVHGLSELNLRIINCCQKNCFKVLIEGRDLSKPMTRRDPEFQSWGSLLKCKCPTALILFLTQCASIWGFRNLGTSRSRAVTMVANCAKKRFISFTFQSSRHFNSVYTN